jgi:putative GTP pyrophosphokinase
LRVSSCGDWYESHREIYDSLRERVEEFLDSMLNKEGMEKGSDYVFVGSRLKSKTSFERKLRTIENGSLKYSKPEEITDIAGIRIVGYVLADIKPISTLVERYFRIDRKKSVDKATKLGKSKVGIRSKHYIAELLGEQLESIKGYPDSSKFEGLFFEIQVKTLLDYAWSEIEHDRNYKTAIEFRKPSYIQRRLMLVAGLLEVADNEFEQLSTETQKYAKPIPSRILNAT